MKKYILIWLFAVLFGAHNISLLVAAPDVNTADVIEKGNNSFVYDEKVFYPREEIGYGYIATKGETKCYFASFSADLDVTYFAEYDITEISGIKNYSNFVRLDGDRNYVFVRYKDNKHALINLKKDKEYDFKSLTLPSGVTIKDKSSLYLSLGSDNYLYLTDGSDIDESPYVLKIDSVDTTTVLNVKGSYTDNRVKVAHSVGEALSDNIYAYATNGEIVKIDKSLTLSIGEETTPLRIDETIVSPQYENILDLDVDDDKKYLLYKDGSDYYSLRYDETKKLFVKETQASVSSSSSFVRLYRGKQYVAAQASSFTITDVAAGRTYDYGAIFKKVLSVDYFTDDGTIYAAAYGEDDDCFVVKITSLNDEKTVEDIFIDKSGDSAGERSYHVFGCSADGKRLFVYDIEENVILDIVIADIDSDGYPSATSTVEIIVPDALKVNLIGEDEKIGDYKIDFPSSSLRLRNDTNDNIYVDGYRNNASAIYYNAALRAYNDFAVLKMNGLVPTRVGTDTYRIDVDNSVATVNINVASSFNKVIVSGTGSHPLNDGLNSFSVTLTALDGSVKTLTLQAYRRPAGGGTSSSSSSSSSASSSSSLSGGSSSFPEIIPLPTTTSGPVAPPSTSSSSSSVSSSSTSSIIPPSSSSASSASSVISEIKPSSESSTTTVSSSSSVSSEEEDEAAKDDYLFFWGIVLLLCLILIGKTARDNYKERRMKKEKETKKEATKKKASSAKKAKK